jgi:hypothetical protein
LPAGQRIGRVSAQIVHLVARSCRATAGEGPAATAAERWQIGHDAYHRGEIPPADADEAEGWYWAQNKDSGHR